VSPRDLSSGAKYYLFRSARIEAHSLEGYRHFAANAAVLDQYRPRLYFCLFPSYFCFVPKCPTCRKQVEWRDNPWRPFCSERCKLIDFDKWTSEEYRVPGRHINPAEIVERPESEKPDDKENATD